MTTVDTVLTAREEMARHGRSLFDRGLATGSSGNLSIRLDDGSMLVTPTNASLGAINPITIAHVGTDGAHLSGDPASKEAFLHRAIYQARPEAKAIIHLHATHSAAVSCMEGLNPQDCLPPLTPYFVMKIGHLPILPYHRPGDKRLAEGIQALAAQHPAMLLANHGPIVAGTTLTEALYRIEELEETAKLFLLLRGSATRPLNATQIAELEAVFGPAARP